MVVDPVHGQIALTKAEWQVVDTPSFQRLRHIKQLQFGHVTYPNATHTRFAHSLGVCAIMQRVLSVVTDQLNEEQCADLRLAALTHDIGHYPYSHLLEGVDSVMLTEDQLSDSTPDSGTRKLSLSISKYPKHEELGRLIVTKRPDIVDAIGSNERAVRIADLFTRSGGADMNISRLIHSSLDMDRLDYLLRDAKACGVPYGEIDLNYLMANFKVSPKGMIGIDSKATAAAEHFMLARFFMHRAVYFHKTTFALEEACRQLLRRCRDHGRHGVPVNGDAVREIVQSDGLGTFTDSFVDRVIQDALSDPDEVIKALARCLAYRRPPKLLREVSFLVSSDNVKDNACSAFLKDCKFQLAKLARDNSLPLGRFLLAQPKPVAFEKRGRKVNAAEVGNMEEEEKDELIKVFAEGKGEPVSLVDLQGGLMADLADRRWHTARLYVVSEDEALVDKLRKIVRGWN